MRKLDNGSEEISTSEELGIIRKMIDKTKAHTAEVSIYFIVWGWVAFIACLLTYILVYFDQERLIWLMWLILMSLGGITVFVFGIKQGKRIKVKTYTDQSYSSLWGACCVSFIIVFVGWSLGAISMEILVPLIAIIAGLGTFVTGGIIEWKPFCFSGIVWWISAIIMMLIHWHYHNLVMAITIVPGYLIPGYVLRKKYLKK